MAGKGEAVIFDMDGVIFDSETLVLNCWREVAECHGIRNIEIACHECLGTNSAVSKQIFLRHYGQDFQYDEYNAEMSEVFFGYASGGRLKKKPGVEKLLKYLKESGIKVALASSTREAVVKKELEEGGLLGYFDEIVCGDMVKRSKPEPDIFLEACRRLRSEPKKCYVIEDSYNGIRAAHAAGMHPIMVPDLMEPTEEMQGLAETILGSLYDVIGYLEPFLPGCITSENGYQI